MKKNGFYKCIFICKPSSFGAVPRDIIIETLINNFKTFPIFNMTYNLYISTGKNKHLLGKKYKMKNIQ